MMPIQDASLGRAPLQTRRSLPAEGLSSGTASRRPTALDVVTFGEAMVRLGSPWGESLESARQFQVHVAGAEAKVAIALARLGFRSAWVSKLADGPLSRTVANELRSHGVDVSGVIWTSRGRMGLYFVEHGPVAPRDDDPLRPGGVGLQHGDY